MSTSRWTDQSERTRRRLAELNRNHGETIARAQLYYRGSQSSWRADGAVGDQRQLIEQQHLASMRARACECRREAREASRRAMNAMTKTVEIADGSSDFLSLMVAEFGMGILHSWKHARVVFEDVTGLRLIPESEENEDS